MNHPFWFLLMVACIGWYATVTVYVGIRGAFDIRHMLERLKETHGENGAPDQP